MGESHKTFGTTFNVTFAPPGAFVECLGASSKGFVHLHRSPPLPPSPSTERGDSHAAIVAPLLCRNHLIDAAGRVPRLRDCVTQCHWENHLYCTKYFEQMNTRRD